MNTIGIYYDAVIGNFILSDDIISYKEKDCRTQRKIQIGGTNRIFTEFISIDPTDTKRILEFYNCYGYLGMRYHFGSSDFFTGDNQNTKIVFGESLLEMQYHIELMKSIIWINYYANSCDDFDILLKNYNCAYEFVERISSRHIDSDEILLTEVNRSCFDYFLNKITIEELKSTLPIDELQFECSNILIFVMNYFLSFTHPCIKSHIECTWNVTTLLAAMYFEIFLLLNEEKMIRKCANKTCSNYFEIVGNDTRKIYCSPHCAQLEAKRNQRKRDKEREGALDGEHSES